MVRAARLEGAPIDVLLGNVSAHNGSGIRRWAKKIKVEWCFTPTYAWWANPVEAYFGPLRQFTVATCDPSNHTVQTRRPLSECEHRLGDFAGRRIGDRGGGLVEDE